MTVLGQEPEHFRLQKAAVKSKNHRSPVKGSEDKWNVLTSLLAAASSVSCSLQMLRLLIPEDSMKHRVQEQLSALILV